MCSIPGLESWVAQLDALPTPNADAGSALADDVVALRRLVERAQVAYLAYVAALDSACSGVVAGEHTAGFIASEVGLPIRVTRREVDLAKSLHTDAERPCEGTRVALDAGTLTSPQAEVIARTMQKLLPEHVAEQEPTVAAACAEAAPSATDQICRRALLVQWPGHTDQDAKRREERAYAARHLHVSPVADLIRVDGMLPALEGAMVMAALDALAQPTAAERQPDAPARSRPQLMADALIELARRQLNGDGLPTSGGVRPNVHVTVDLADLLNRTGTGRIEGRSQGTITGESVHRLGCDGYLDWSVTTDDSSQPPRGEPRKSEPAVDEAGVNPAMLTKLITKLAPALGGSAPTLLAAGRTSRLVTPAQRKALIHRDRGCTYPGCDRPPEWCEAHHLKEWVRHHGDTDIENLALTCHFHHIRLHVNGETLAHDENGWRRVPASAPGEEPAA